MKRSSTIMACAVVASLALAAVATGQGATAPAKKKAAPAAAASGVEDQIKAMEKERAAAAVKADTGTLEKMTADDYTFINQFGAMSDKARTMASLKSGDIKLSANDVSDLKVRVYGNAAVVTGRSDLKGTSGGKAMSGAVLFTRVYVKKDGRWLAVAFQQTAVQP